MIDAMDATKQSGIGYYRIRIFVFSIMLTVGGTQTLAQTGLERVFLSGDIHARLETVDGTLITGSDQTVLDLNPETGNGMILAELSTDDARLDLDALGFSPDGAIFSVDTTTTLSGMDVQPRDVLAEQGSGLAFAFAGADHGIPDGVSVDAVSRDPETGDLLLSFDRTITLPGPGRSDPQAVLRFNGTTFSEEFNGAIVPANSNLDAVHVLGNGNILMSFDIDVVLPGSNGTINAADDDIVEFSAGSGEFSLTTFRLREFHNSWQQADVDAIWTDEINGGRIRFTDSLRQAREDIGTLVLTLERIDASGGPLAVEVTSVDGTAAVADGDYVELNQVVTWGDGELGQRQVIVKIVDDGALESTTEFFELRSDIASGFAALVDPSNVTIEIIDNDGDRIFADSFESSQGGGRSQRYSGSE